jgi:uncharacterized protein
MGCDLTAKKAQSGDAEAQYKMGMRYMDLPPDALGNKEMEKWFRKAAEQGHAKAQCCLGDCYHTDFGVNTVDHTEAFKWYLKSAQQGYPEAQCKLGSMYTDGKGAPVSMPEAIRWLGTAAGQKYAPAECALGMLYKWGKNGIDQDMSEAKRHFRAAADLGDESGLTLWLDFYRDRDDPEKIQVNGPRAAVERWRNRAAGGDAHAQYYLGVLYSDGDGVPRDSVEAGKWLLSAAARGNVSARLRLGMMCETGLGMPLDRVEAYKWFNLAAVSGATGGLEGRERLVKVLTPEEIAEGQRRSTAYSGGMASGASVGSHYLH